MNEGPPGHLRAWAGPDLGGTSFRGHSQGQEGLSLAATVGPLHVTHAVWRLCTLGPIRTPRKRRYMLPDLLPPIMRPPGHSERSQALGQETPALIQRPLHHKESSGGAAGGSELGP